MNNKKEKDIMLLFLLGSYCGGLILLIAINVINRFVTFADESLESHGGFLGPYLDFFSPYNKSANAENVVKRVLYFIFYPIYFLILLVVPIFLKIKKG